MHGFLFAVILAGFVCALVLLTAPELSTRGGGRASVHTFALFHLSFLATHGLFCFFFSHGETRLLGYSVIGFFSMWMLADALILSLADMLRW